MKKIYIDMGKLELNTLASMLEKGSLLGVLAVRFYGVEKAFEMVKQLRNKTKQQIVDHFYQLSDSQN